ncbi:2768_t:CDS:1, partial [Funneliformis geosporum]
MPSLRTKKTQKQHRSAINDEIKYQICEWSKANENKQHLDITNHFNKLHPNLVIDRSTISKILLHSDKWKE